MRRARTVLVHASLWLALSLITASQGILTYLATGGEVLVVTVLLLNLALWFPWAALSPVILAAARRWPLHGPGWPRRLAAHVSLNLALAIVAALLYRLLRVAIGMPPRGNYALMIASGLNTSLLVYWGLVVIAHATAYYRRSQERQRLTVELDRQLAQTRLEALRAQIQPHFLFNTLHAIASRIRSDPRGAEDMLGSLGELLRTHLQGSVAHEVPLRQELDLVDRYVAIQQVRFDDRLSVERRIDPATLDVRVPVLLLQPLVENAIEHGIAQRLSGGTLGIAADLRGDELHLRVRDDGQGTAPLDESQWHVGLTNTRDRLRALYGEAQTLRVASAAMGGFEVSITMPAKRVVSG
ncbi:MAG TPA: sensor histidine kinase [Gemmatimonadaceae bacterium]|nr:sensor histidine kinase [Gemmatimonadaceae bacterium]